MSFDHISHASITRRPTTLRPAALSLLALVGVACGTGESDDSEALSQIVSSDRTDLGNPEGKTDLGSTEGEADAGTDEGEQGPAEPGSPAFVSVGANGTGCPKGTWETKLADDGETYTTRSTACEATLADGARSAFKDCNLSIALQAPEGLSYALTDFSYYGHVKLDQGVRGFATLNDYFQGNPTPSQGREKRIELAGPIDEPLVAHIQREGADRVWSPCGLTRDLNIVTRVGVSKGADVAGSGAVKVEGLGNPEDPTLSFKLAWRRCSDGSPVEPPVTTPPTPEEPDETVEDGGTVTPDAGSDAGTPKPRRPRWPRWPWGR